MLPTVLSWTPYSETGHPHLFLRAQSMENNIFIMSRRAHRKYAHHQHTHKGNLETPHQEGGTMLSIYTFAGYLLKTGKNAWLEITQGRETRKFKTNFKTTNKIRNQDEAEQTRVGNPLWEWQKTQKVFPFELSLSWCDLSSAHFCTHVYLWAHTHRCMHTLIWLLFLTKENTSSVLHTHSSASCGTCTLWCSFGWTQWSALDPARVRKENWLF